MMSWELPLKQASPFRSGIMHERDTGDSPTSDLQHFLPAVKFLLLGNSMPKVAQKSAIGNLVPTKKKFVTPDLWQEAGLFIQWGSLAKLKEQKRLLGGSVNQIVFFCPCLSYCTYKPEVVDRRICWTMFVIWNKLPNCSWPHVKRK